MDADTRESITWFLGTIVTLSVIAGLLVRFVLMPYLREHLIAPVKETNKQVTENHHSNERPTVLDKIDDVHQEVTALARVLEGHMEWSERWSGVTEREIALTNREIEMFRREHGNPPA